jgi:hypothetical protein
VGPRGTRAHGRQSERRDEQPDLYVCRCRGEQACCFALRKVERNDPRFYAGSPMKLTRELLQYCFAANDQREVEGSIRQRPRERRSHAFGRTRD